MKKDKTLSSYINEKPETVRTTFDCDSNLIKKADEIMTRNKHSRRQIIEAALKKYIEENKNA